MKRIYISKSKMGNPDDLAFVRSFLKGFNCEVLEFFGGTYNTEKLDQANILIIIPPDLNCAAIGKGQQTEAERFALNTKKSYKECDIFVVRKICPGEVVISQLKGIEVVDRNWQNDYGIMQLIGIGNLSTNLSARGIGQRIEMVDVGPSKSLMLAVWA